ncbi:DUF3014 domain-containing protein [Corallococcus sp. bb12-1]|uniref:DUF3014 domain-containing protein n=1 Tax=Corallococcus sp. bb12-1 TaxID=2996784 RepID=UPI0022716157|nr:DUF3014 domain-containing protein [Corallococcus sp. bb12-1]MCY1041715.1 DUF3014 domain-containing protein [Corallococcus sp. bb12-1]
MSDPNFVNQPPGVPPPPVADPPKAPSRGKVLGILVALMVVALVASYFGLKRQSEPAPVVVTPAVVDAGVVALPPDVSLPESDGRVRELVRKLSVDPELARWLEERDLARRFTSSVNNIAEGESPRASLLFMAPQGGFEVAAFGTGGRTSIAPASYARYDLVARVLGSLDATGAGLVYRELKPLIDQAYREIAPPGQTFEVTFGRAVQHLLAVPVPPGPVEVESKGALYVYTAPELEGLSRAQKHLLRMGPGNIRIIQAKLREMRTALNLPTPAPTTPEPLPDQEQVPGQSETRQ